MESLKTPEVGLLGLVDRLEAQLLREQGRSTRYRRMIRILEDPQRRVLRQLLHAAITRCQLRIQFYSQEPILTPRVIAWRRASIRLSDYLLNLERAITRNR